MKPKSLLFISIFLLTFSLFAQTNQGWHNLFMGKDLQGWKQLNGKAKYEAKNGEIVGTAVSGEPNSFLSEILKSKNYNTLTLISPI